jgi:hypothetical protein
MAEGWSDAMVARRTGTPRTPYSVYIGGKKWKDFENDDHAEAVANKLRAKFKADGRDPATITIAPTDMSEGTMASAEKHLDGPEFTGYWKGTNSATPGDKMVGSMEEGAKVDRMVKHIEKSERATGKSKKDAESIAWATANKRGYLDNANKKDVDEGIAGNMQVRSTPINLRTPKVPNIAKAGKGPHNNALKKAQARRVAENFVQWAVNEGYTNFASNPAVYEQAKLAYKLNENLTKTSTEQLQAIWDSHKDEQRPSPALAMKLKAVARELQRRKSVNEDFGSLFTTATEAWNIISLIKEYGLPLGLFAAAVGMYGLARAAEYLEQGEDKFAQMAKPALKKVPSSTIHQITDKLNQAFVNVSSKAATMNPMNTAMDFAEEKQKSGKAVGEASSPAQQAAIAIAKKEKQDVDEDWQKANKKDKTDGMSQKAVNAYKRENPGSKLKTAVTTKPSKLKKGSKASKRRSSYCSRSKGQQKMHNISCAKTPDKAICKARRRWNCESIENLDIMLAEAIEKGKELTPGQYYIWTVYFDDGSKKQVKVTKDTFDPKAYYAKKNQNVIKVDYSWEPHNG